MKKRAELKNLLGLTQDEMTLVLGITQTQWSMRKSGKCDLSLVAMQQLLLCCKVFKTSKPSSKPIIYQRVKSKKQQKVMEHYEKMQIKLHRLKMEIIFLENQRAECFVALLTVAFLEQQNEISGLATSIKTRVIKSLLKHSLFKTEQLQLQKKF